MPAPHQKKKLHPQDQKNLLLFALAFGVLYLLFDAFFLKPHMEKMDAYHDLKVQEKAVKAANFKEVKTYTLEEILAKDSRANFSHESLDGSINLKGGRLDNIQLNNYFETLKKDKKISVISPEETPFPRYIDFGWLDNKNNDGLPDGNSLWKIKSQDPQKLTLEWDNGKGLRFERDVMVTDKFLIKITQRIHNYGQNDLTLFPYTLITEHGLPTKLMHKWIIHEGPIGFINGTLEERDYSEMSKNPVASTNSIEAQKGWIGFTEQYWLASILPEQNNEKTFRYSYRASKDTDDKRGFFQVDVLSDGQKVNAGETVEHTTHIFAGAKEFNTLKKLEKDLNIENFDAAIDFGWFWFLTKPFFTVLLMINSVVGYFAVTMLIFAFCLRLLIFPLANTSYRSFAKLRIITPRIMEIKDLYKDDKAGLQKAMLELYQKEKVNPAAGCLPILLQIPIFFSLFKVLNIAIEMRHAPGFFWIKDLSAPDPTSLFNLFGLLPYDVPQFLMVGAWPCIMVITLLIQRSLNPPPTDPVIRDMFRFMPYFMGFVMSSFAAGLVIYWTFSNILSSLQQYMIMRMMGVDVQFFQGWFGREYKQNTPDVKKLGLSEDLVRMHQERENKKNSDVQPDDAEVEEEVKEISAPKPKKKKKKK